MPSFLKAHLVLTFWIERFMHRKPDSAMMISIPISF